jgi:hypothetical protein
VNPPPDRKRVDGNPPPTVRAPVLDPTIVTCDFCVAATAPFRILYVFVVIEHASRQLIRLNATAHPTAAWTLQQLRETIPSDHGYRFIIQTTTRSFRRIGRFADPARPQSNHHACAQSAGELPLRTADRNPAPRVSGLGYSFERRTPEENPGLVDGPLQPGETTFLLGARHSRSRVRRPATQTLRAPTSERSQSRIQTDFGQTASRIPIANACGVTLSKKDEMEKIRWQGVLLSVKLRIRLTRSLDERSHNYLGYTLKVRDRSKMKPGNFSSGWGKALTPNTSSRRGLWPPVMRCRFPIR